MELDDLKNLWTAQDRKLDAVLKLNARLLQASLLQSTRGPLRRLKAYLWFEAALSVPAFFLLGSFWSDHLREPRFLLPGLALHASVAALLALTLRQLVALHSLDYGAPVVEIQRRLGKLQVESGLSVLGTIAASFLLWVPLLIVFFRGVLGVDPYAAFGLPFLAANAGVGLAVLAAGLLVARRYRGRLESAPRLQALVRALGGGSLQSALRSLDSLDRFEEG